MSLDVYLSYEVEPGISVDIFSNNITHNLIAMAKAAGIYKHLWRPEELGIKTAEQLIEPLTIGLRRLTIEPQAFQQYEPSNGWGSYSNFVPWVQMYLEACKKHPSSTVKVSR